MRFFNSLAVAAICVAVAAIGPLSLCAQVSVDLQRLFERFRSPETTDAATEELMRRGKSDAQAREYLAAHLPMVIEKRTDPKVWANAAQVAGQLRIVETVPALAKWLGQQSQGTITLAGMMQLRNHPAAKALVEIGDPSVPTLSAVLARGNLNERWTAALVAHNIGTPGAQRALRDHAKVEADRTLRDFISNLIND